MSDQEDHGSGEVFLLWHVHEVEDREDGKLIGVYSSKEAAEQALARVATLTGFKGHRQGFKIARYLLDADHWTEGFVTL